MGPGAKSGSKAADETAGHRAEDDFGRIDPALVREQLERILDSPEFLGSGRARRFLRYVVEETLADRADRVKAFSVAVAAFDRDESFDPQTDPIVRIEAGRLRRSLERYYLVAGASDRVRIDIPKGSYVPVFTLRGGPDAGAASAEEEVPDETAEPKSPPPGPLSRFTPARLAVGLALTSLVATLLLALWIVPGGNDLAPVTNARPDLPQPSIGVLPFTVTGAVMPAAHLSSGMASELVRELSQYSSIFVLGPQSLQRFGATPDITLVGSESGVTFVLSGDIHLAGDRMRVAVRLSDTMTGGVHWAEAYERAFIAEGIFDLQAEIARDIVRRIAQPQGAIALFDWKRTRGKAPETWDAYDCVVQADELHRRVQPPALAPEVRACLRRAIEEEPGYADGWVMSALVELDALRFTPLALSPRTDAEAGLAAAKRAVDLAPDSGRAHLALMMGLYFQGEVAQALAAGELAVRMSPHDPDILGEVGMRNILAGDVDAGVALVEQAIKLYQSVPLTSRLALAMAALRKGQYLEASDAAKGDGQRSNFVYWSMVSAIHGRAGRLDEARHAAGELLKLYPDFPEWAWVEMAARNLVPEIATAMAEGWRAAGLPVPLEPQTLEP